MKSESLYSKSIERFIRVSGFLFFLFGFLAILLRITQYAILGDPPLEEIVLAREFLILQGIPSLLAAVFFLLGITALHLRQAHRTGSLGWVVFLLHLRQ